MGACAQAEAKTTIRQVKAPQKAVIKNTNAQVSSNPVLPRAPEAEATPAKIRVRTHPNYELELNEAVEEPWVCMGDEEADGCQADSPQF